MSAVTSSSTAGSTVSGRSMPQRRVSWHAGHAGRRPLDGGVGGGHRVAYFRPAAFRWGSAFADHSKKSFEPNS